MAGKRGSRRHSATSFRENVGVAGTSYQMQEVLLFCYREMLRTSFSINKHTSLFSEKSKIKLSRVSFFFRTRTKTLSSISYSYSSKDYTHPSDIVSPTVLIIMMVIIKTKRKEYAIKS